MVFTDSTDPDVQTELRRIPVTGILAYADVDARSLHACLHLAASDIRFGSGLGADAVFGSEAPATALTLSERDVLLGLEEGLSTAEIAVKEHLNPRTVERHIRSMMDKAGVGNQFLLGRKLSSSVARAQGVGKRQ